uniref:SET domain-containing protein n=1 Tax=Schizophyllum commune (strain H4-8 / FGSC 9210) TaxID=578458 RepID=D8Q2M2_SCHCM
MLHLTCSSDDPRRPEDNSPRDLRDMAVRVGNGQAMFTTIPANARSRKDELLRDGTTEVMLDAATKRKLYAQPGFPKPLTQPSSPAHRISPAGEKGLGMFATRPLHAGDLILAERPLMVRALGAPLYTGPQMGLFRNPSSLVSRVIDKEYQIEVMMQRMVPKNRNAFLTLANSDDYSGTGNLVGRMYTNGRDVLQGFTFSGMPGGGATYTGVFDKLSRMNHSCTPNAVFTWANMSFSGALRAIRDIQPDEEITITYCNPSLSTSERAAALAPYDIECDCPACKDGSASDARRDDIFAKFDKAQELELNDAKREMLLSVIELIEKEGAEVLPEYYEAHRLLLNIYREEKSKKEAKVAEEKGTKDEKVTEEEDGDSRETESELEEKSGPEEEKASEPEEEEEATEKTADEEKEGDSKETDSELKEKESGLEERKSEPEDEEETKVEEKKESEPEENNEPADKEKELEQKVNALSLAKFGKAFLRE